MKFIVSITFDSYVVLRNVLDDCRVRHLTNFSYERLLSLTVDLETQATRRKRIADVICLNVSNDEYLVLRECVIACRCYGLSTRLDHDVDVLETELEWSKSLADALAENVTNPT